MIAALAALWLTAAAEPPAPLPLPPPSCSVFTANGLEAVETIQIPGLSEALATPDQPLPPLPIHAAAISCRRGTLEPEPYDDRALTETHVRELLLNDTDGRTAKLVRERGRFVYTFAEGRRDRDLKAVVAERLKTFEARTTR